MNARTALILAGSGEADSYQRDLFTAQVRSTVRFADPAAWITATAVAKALAESGDLLAQWRHEIGMVAISDHGPRASMAKMQMDGATGFSLPLHYAASSPGTLVGVPAIAFGLRGPMLNLTMDPRDGLAVALTMCAGWLERKAARLMVVATCRELGPEKLLSRAVLLAPSGFLESGEPLTESATSWLTLADRSDRVPE
jgi:hypothetical protein